MKPLARQAALDDRSRDLLARYAREGYSGVDWHLRERELRALRTAYLLDALGRELARHASRLAALVRGDRARRPHRGIVTPSGGSAGSSVRS